MNKKLHLGCGERFLEGYIHVDINYYPHIDYQCSIDNLYMFEDNSVDLIYSSHNIEYFDRDEIITVLQEWKRVLKKGGILRLAVPDFESLIKIYKKTKNLGLILGPLYGKWKMNDSTHLYHKTVYDFKDLKNILLNTGFKNIKKWDWREVFYNLPKYDDHSQAYFPHMDKLNGLLVSLNIEGEKK